MKTHCLQVDPGICGFTCTIKSSCSDKRAALIEITGSGCSMIQDLASMVTEISFKDMFVPLTENPIFTSAEKAGCHLACPVPIGVAKAAEAALTLALPRDISLRFE